MLERKFYRSPLFYMGDKFKLLSEILGYFPLKINKYIEPFVGGGSVFLNVNANNYLLNDINSSIVNLHKFLIKYSENPDEFFKRIINKIEYYNLSRSFKEDIVPLSLKKKWNKTYYAKFNREGYEKLKNDFNRKNKKDYFDLYLLLIYGFNRIIRFNSKGEFNIPVGNVDFNKNVYNSLKEYFKVVKMKKIELYNYNFIDFIHKIRFEEDDFIYFDPPYLITNSEYNKIWDENSEKNLITILDILGKNKINFAISNVIEYKGKENSIFIDWAKNYNLVRINSNYISFHDNSIKNFTEVLVMNYDFNITTNSKLNLFKKDIYKVI